jgi:maltodextrin utilization protein YvdJ
MIDRLRNKSSLKSYASTSSIEQLFIGSEFDHVVRRIFAYFIPVFMFLFILGMMLNSMYLLFVDTQRFTLFDLVESAYAKSEPVVLNNTIAQELHHDLIRVGNMMATVTQDRQVGQMISPLTLEDRDKNLAALAIADVGHSNQMFANQEMFATSTHHLNMLADILVTQENNLEEIVSGNQMTNVHADTYVLVNKRDASLVEFMRANGLDNSFVNRKKFATYFGITPYKGSKKQNEELKDVMLGIRFSDMLSVER